jgi:hypothetical protein
MLDHEAQVPPDSSGGLSCFRDETLQRPGPGCRAVEGRLRGSACWHMAPRFGPVSQSLACQRLRLRWVCARFAWAGTPFRLAGTGRPLSMVVCVPACRTAIGQGRRGDSPDKMLRTAERRPEAIGTTTWIPACRALRPTPRVRVQGPACWDVLSIRLRRRCSCRRLALACQRRAPLPCLDTANSFGGRLVLELERRIAGRVVQGPSDEGLAAIEAALGFPACRAPGSVSGSYG